MENYLVLKKPQENALVSYIKRRITKQNRNFLPFFSGATGSGKTYSAMDLAKKIDPDFCIEYVVFDFKSLINLCTDEVFLKRKIKVIIFEEAQISQGAGNWQSKANKLMNMFLSTFRHLNICVIFTSPFLDFVDSKSRRLIHMELRMMNISKQKKKAVCAPRFMQWNGDKKKFYIHKLRVIMGKHDVRAVDFMAFDLPDKELIKAYEEKKNEFTRQLNISIKAQLKALEDAEIPIDKRRRLTDIQRDIYTRFARGKKQVDIAAELGITTQAVSSCVLSVEKKGYKKNEFLENQNQEISSC